ncbi:hypothetical protein C8R30_1062 [Nitrosomonas nitrosa]|jgi:hypothetical protein|nr:hypothetical protein C8R30_1062 [Nitrosomonas nitrosa]
MDDYNTGSKDENHITASNGQQQINSELIHTA